MQNMRFFSMLKGNMLKKKSVDLTLRIQMLGLNMLVTVIRRNSEAEYAPLEKATRSGLADQEYPSGNLINASKAN